MDIFKQENQTTKSRYVNLDIKAYKTERTKPWDHTVRLIPESLC